MKKRLCCCIPDQTKLDEGCQSLAEYEIWMGDNPTPDDYTDSCAEHLEIMLDDSSRFEIMRIKPIEGDAREDSLQIMGEKERGDRLEAMIDRMAGKLSDCTLLIVPMRELCLQIERCGASEELTKAVVMASDIQQKLMDAVGIKQLPAGTL